MRLRWKKLLPKRLRAQVGMIVSVLLAATVGLYAWHNSKLQGEYITRVVTGEASITAKSIANLSIPYILTEDYASIETLLIRMVEHPGTLSIAVLDANGNVYSRVLYKEEPVVSYSRVRFEPPGDSRPLLTTIVNDRIIAWHPVFEGSLLGWVKADFSLDMIRDVRSKKHIWKQALLSGLIAVIAGIFLILLFLSRHIRAVGAITDFARSLDMRKGGTTDAGDGSLETEQLVSALNHASRKLHDQDSAIRDSEKKYRTLFEESKDVVFFSTIEGRIVDINPAGLDLFGASSKEELPPFSLGKNPATGSRDGSEFMDLLVRQGFIKDYELTLQSKKGEPVTVLMTATAVRDEEGRLRGFRGILRDVTVERQLESQLRHAQKLEAVGHLTGGIAHDFNNILSAIIGFSHVLHAKLEDGSVLKSHAEMILSSAEKAVGLTRSLLAFSSKQNTNPRLMHLNDMVYRLNALLANVTGEEIDLVLNLTPDNPVVLADEGQMDQVLMNLATNARNAMPSGGTLTIETRVVEFDAGFPCVNGILKQGRYALLSVSDSGKGIDAATVKRIFEPFFTTHEVGKGTGLGLSIVYGIITQHEGYMTVRSAPGAGASFTLYLPASNAAAEKDGEGKAEPEPGGTETILVAEDDSTLRTLLRTVLSDAGYRLVEAADGEDAIARFHDNKDQIRLLLLDVMMPGKNGREVYEEVRKTHPDIKIIFTSAYPFEIMEKSGILEDSMNFLPKPVMPALLLKKIREVLDGA